MVGDCVSVTNGVTVDGTGVKVGGRLGVAVKVGGIFVFVAVGLPVVLVTGVTGALAPGNSQSVNPNKRPPFVGVFVWMFNPQKWLAM